MAALAGLRAALRRILVQIPKANQPAIEIWQHANRALTSPPFPTYVCLRCAATMHSITYITTNLAILLIALQPAPGLSVKTKGPAQSLPAAVHLPCSILTNSPLPCNTCRPTTLGGALMIPPVHASGSLLHSYGLCYHSCRPLTALLSNRSPNHRPICRCSTPSSTQAPRESYYPQ